MTPHLLKYLCEPITKASLQLVNAITDADGQIQSGELVAPSGKLQLVVRLGFLGDSALRLFFYIFILCGMLGAKLEFHSKRSERSA